MSIKLFLTLHNRVALIIRIAHHLFRILRTRSWSSHPRGEAEKSHAFKCQVTLPHPYDARELADRMEPIFAQLYYRNPETWRMDCLYVQCVHHIRGLKGIEKEWKIKNKKRNKKNPRGESANVKSIVRALLNNIILESCATIIR